MKNLKLVKTSANKLSLKGVLLDSDDLVFSYIDDDKVEQTVTIDELLAPFKGQEVSLSVATKMDEEFDAPFEEV